MAGVLETLAGPHPSSFPAASLAPIARSPISRSYGRRRSVKFSDLRGLKIKSARSSGSSSLRFVRPGGLIVCEAQETAVEVPAVTDATWAELELCWVLPKSGTDLIPIDINVDGDRQQIRALWRIKVAVIVGIDIEYTRLSLCVSLLEGNRRANTQQ